MKMLSLSSDVRVVEYLLTSKPYYSYQTIKVVAKAAASSRSADTCSKRYLTKSKRTLAALIKPSAPNRLILAQEYSKCDERDLLNKACRDPSIEVLLDGRENCALKINSLKTLHS